MSIQKIRFRVEGEAVVLQVEELTDTSSPYYGQESKAAWRDAKVTDLLEVARFVSIQKITYSGYGNQSNDEALKNYVESFK